MHVKYLHCVRTFLSEQQCRGMFFPEVPIFPRKNDTQLRSKINFIWLKIELVQFLSTFVSLQYLLTFFNMIYFFYFLPILISSLLIYDGDNMFPSSTVPHGNSPFQLIEGRTPHHLDMSLEFGALYQIASRTMDNSMAPRTTAFHVKHLYNCNWASNKIDVIKEIQLW